MARESQAPSRRHEIIGILMLAAGILLAVSLLSHTPQDPSFTTVTTLPLVKNLAGRVGSHLSDAVFQSIGAAGYFLVAGLIWGGWRKFLNQTIFPNRWRLAGFGILFVFGTALMDLWFDSVPILRGDAILAGRAGGLLGAFTADFLVDYFNLIGAHIIAVAVVLVTLVWTTRVSVRTLGTGSLQMAVALAKWASGAILITRERSRRFQNRIQPKVSGRIAESMKLRATASPAPTTTEKPVEATETTGEPVIRNHPTPKQRNFEFSRVATHGEYQLPPLTLLADPPTGVDLPGRTEILANAQILEKKLLDYDIEGRVTQVHPGPVITMYEFEPAPGVKVNKIVNLSDDLALAMRAMAVRIVAPIPGKSVVGIEIPNVQREDVYLKDMFTSEAFTGGKSKLPLALGKDIFGVPVVADLAAMPHLLVAGATGSGKSVALNSMILSLLFSTSPQDVKTIMIDPKLLELSIYDGIPHLMSPVIVRPKDATTVFARLVNEMQYRYKILAEAGVRNIDGYNKKLAEGKIKAVPPMGGETPDGGVNSPPPTKLPYLVVIVDELADLMMVAAREIEDSITRLAQMARAAGIHLILATQRPSVDVLTGLIKANFPARISFQVSSKTDSRTILDANGAEQLLGRGDMLFMHSGPNRLTRIHGAYVTEPEIRKVVDFAKAQAKPHYIDLVAPKGPSQIGDEEDDGERDEFYQRAIDIVVSASSASASLIQRRLRVGYPRAARMIEMMEEDGIVGPAAGGKPREVLLKRAPGEQTI